MSEEMNPFAQQVGREYERFAAADGQYGSVVSDSFEVARGLKAAEPADVFDQSEFGHVLFSGFAAGA